MDALLVDLHENSIFHSYFLYPRVSSIVLGIHDIVSIKWSQQRQLEYQNIL